MTTGAATNATVNTTAATLHTRASPHAEPRIHLPGRGEHEHTAACHLYGFHDLRQAFAMMNADNPTPDALHAHMRHKSYQMTQVYINMASQWMRPLRGCMPWKC